MYFLNDSSKGSLKLWCNSNWEHSIIFLDWDLKFSLGIEFYLINIDSIVINNFPFYSMIISYTVPYSRLFFLHFLIWDWQQIKNLEVFNLKLNYVPSLIPHWKIHYPHLFGHLIVSKLTIFYCWCLSWAYVLVY